MRTLEAEITWRTEAEGCLEQPFSGIRPSFAVGGDLVMSRVDAMDGSADMQRGKCYNVLIDLPYGEHYKEHLQVGMEARLQVGARIIGSGVVTKIRPS